MKKFMIFFIMICFIAAGLTAQQNNMVRIEGGTFTMGSPDNELNRYDEETQKQVTVSSFWMGKYEVTHREFQEIMGYNPNNFTGDLNRPVEQVTWFDAVEYCNKLSQKEGFTPVYTITGRTPATGYPITAATVTANWDANGYRLPTEAEWEYACRAGTTTAYNTGDNISLGQANFYSDEWQGMTTPVGSYAPNAWGLCDMHGNVFEWCWDWDWYGDYTSGEQTNRGAVSGYFRVVRGGSWGNNEQFHRSAYRHSNHPSYRDNTLGFRVVRL